jgi:outer membrane protein TolC
MHRWNFSKSLIVLCIFLFVFAVDGPDISQLKAETRQGDLQNAPALQAQEQTPQPLKLALADCIRMALEANLDLRIEGLNPEMDAASASQTKEQFLPQFGVNSSYLNQDQPSTWGVEGPTVSIKRDYYYFDLSQRIPTGTEATLSLYTQKTDTSRAFTTVNPAYYSEFRLRLVQPLLRGFGTKINRYETIKAERQFDMSIATLKSTFLQTIYSVEEAYWNLYYARESLRVLEQSLDQSREMLRRNQEASRIGTKSAIEVLSAEAQAAGYENGILSARLQIQKMENRLKSLLNIPVEAEAALAAAESGRETAAIIPTDRPDVEKRAVTYDEALRTALAERPEIKRTESLIANAASDIGYAKNQLLPRLDLNLSFWFPGQSGVRYIFQDNNPLTGIIVGKVIGSRGESIKDILKAKYQNLSVDVTLTVPLSSFFSRAGLARAKLTQAQADLQLEKERKAIEVEVLEAIKDLEASARKIDTSARYRELVEKQVVAETQRYELGLVGSEWLFTYQKNLSQAKVDEIKAMIDHKIALAGLEKAMGTTLKTKGLKFREYCYSMKR